MTTITNFSNLPVNSISTTILSGQTKSLVVDISGATLKTIYLPASMTGTKLTFEVSYDGVTFLPYANIDNNLVEIDISPARAYGLSAIDFYGIQFFKIVSNAVEAADRVITLSSRGI